MKNKGMKCVNHPYYKGIHKPRYSCHVCWAIFELARDKPKPVYPRITALGLTVHLEPCLYIDRKELYKILRNMGMVRLFNKLFGIQTQFVKGPFPWDVEAVLERIASGKLQGSQALWD